MRQHDLDFLFHPNSIALVGITTAKTWHWTLTFLEGLLEIGFDRPLYLVNPKGGELEGHKIYASLKDVPGNVDYVIGLVNAQIAPKLVEECAQKGVRAIHFCTAGFSETGEEEGRQLEKQVTEITRNGGLNLVGPNCFGIYVPASKLAYWGAYPTGNGSVAFISQSGGHGEELSEYAQGLGIQFSKIISFGNACGLQVIDFLEYLVQERTAELLEAKIAAELLAAEEKFPGWPSDVIHAAAIVAEECGELVRAAVDFHFGRGSREALQKEAVQTGAMAQRFLMHIEDYPAMIKPMTKYKRKGDRP